MKSKFALAALMAVSATPALIPTAAFADGQQHHYYHTYRGRHYHYRCGGGNGAVGTIAGGVGGALIGNAIGGGTLGTIAGGLGGGLLGRHLDKQHTRHRNGC
jgi:outer membrane lipoprotein SlyB